MNKPSETEARLIETLARTFYEVVPEELRTYCAVTSKISKSVLRKFGINAQLVPCQSWYETPTGIYIVGFVGKENSVGKWDGHVVCSTENFVIDTALHHFKKDFGVDSPPVAVTTKFEIPSQVIARREIDDGSRLWWYYPPKGVNQTVPDEPADLIAKHAARLIDRLEEYAPSCLQS